MLQRNSKARFETVTALGAAERQKCTQAYGELPAWTTTPPVTPLETYKQRCIH